MSQYAALSHEDKKKLYDLTYENYKTLHAPSHFAEALRTSKEKIAKYFRKIKPAEDRLEIVALQKWYLELMTNIEAPDDSDLQSYFMKKAEVMAYLFNTLSEQLGLIRREAADLLTMAVKDLFGYVGEVTGTF
jgi:hypothetical protein